MKRIGHFLRSLPRSDGSLLRTCTHRAAHCGIGSFKKSNISSQCSLRKSPQRKSMWTTRILKGINPKYSCTIW
eukprot:4383209-Pyramimonas_sp.AAC.1